MKRTMSKALACLSTPPSLKKEMCLVNLAGFLIFKLRNPRITNTVIPPIENYSMLLKNTQLSSTLQVWQTLNFSDKMHLIKVLQEFRLQVWAVAQVLATLTPLIRWEHKMRRMLRNEAWILWREWVIQRLDDLTSMLWGLILCWDLTQAINIKFIKLYTELWVYRIQFHS